MKRTIIALAAAFLACAGVMHAQTISDLSLEGEIQGENIMFSLAFKADATQKESVLPLVIGDVAYLDGKLPRGAEMVRDGDKYVLKLRGGGFFGSRSQSVSCRFASRSVKGGDWRSTHFQIPAASIRKLSVLCDRNDLEVKFPGALNVQRTTTKEGKTQVTAFLGVSSMFEVAWKPEIKRFESELVVSCDANTIGTASVGALRMDTVYSCYVIQGRLNRIVLAMPEVNVTQVQGQDIQDWRIDRADPANPKLVVTLSRPQEEIYRFRVESEMTLAKFPCKFNLPVMVPEGVLRTSGSVVVGTDSAIKLQIGKAAGLTQVDQAAFAATAIEPKAPPRARPARSTFAYQYANMPYTMSVSADDIVTGLTVEDLMVLSLSDNELTFDVSVQIDVKDAPAREILIESDADPLWTVTSMTGQNVSEADADVRNEGGKRTIYVPFKQAVSGTVLVKVKMEKTLKPDDKSFSAPRFTVQGAKSERGYLLVAAEKGIRLKTEAMNGLREVHTGSAPVKVADAQQAFRFKDGKWSVTLGVERTLSAIHSEVFHLVSLGEGVSYCSAAITYHIGGAPVQEFKVRIPKGVQTVEFTGSDIEGWTRDGETCTVKLQTRVMGDYTLLVTWDRQFNYYEGAAITVGEVETLGTESEVGYVAIASSASISPPKDLKAPPGSLIKIDRSEIPPAYASPIADPIIGSWKYVSRPHAFEVKVEPYKTEQLLRQVADFIRIRTELSRDGEAVTTVNYYLKNTSRQYLVVKLPAGVNLWSIQYVDAAGRKTPALSQQSEKGYLVPVSRPRDPNTPIGIEVQYAGSYGNLGFWRSGFKGVNLEAAVLPETHATFASWLVEVPEGFSIAEARGNMTAALGSSLDGWVGVLKKTGRLLGAILDGWGRSTIRDALSGGWGGNRTAEFTRSVNLSGSDALQLNLLVLPGWMGANSSARLLVVCLALGLLLLVRGTARGSAGLKAAGFTVVAFGLACSAAGRSVIASVVVLLVVMGIFSGAGRKVIGFVFGGIWRIVKAPFRRRKTDLDDEIPPLEEDVPPPLEGGEGNVNAEADMDMKAKDGKSGRISMALLVLLAATALLGPALAARATVPFMDSLKVTVEAPGTGRDIEQSAKVTAVFEFRTTEAVSFVVLPSTNVLTAYELDSSDMSLAAQAGGYLLTVKGGGRHRVTLKYQAPVEAREGQWSLGIPMLPTLLNTVTLKIPEPGLDVISDSAVLFKSEEKKGSTEAEAVFGPVGMAGFVWKPRVRKTKLEQAVFFSEVNTYAGLQPGVVELTNLIRCQIAQGEIKELKVKIPVGMSVTGVKAAGLATWSFDPEKRVLDAVLERPVSGDFNLVVVTQVACEGLPYTAVLGVVQVVDASRQRGSLAISAPDMIQVRIDDAKGLNPMNIEDFSTEAMAMAGVARARPVPALRKAYRYNQAEDVSVKVQTEKVLPEIRVAESGTLSIADERIVLATKLDLSIAKSGVFSAELGIPQDFDVETLTGPDVSHWDEIKDGARGVVVYFARQVTDATTVNLVIGRTEKGIEQKIVVPRVTVKDAAKHSGRLMVSGERGVRLMVDSHEGVDIKKASEEGIRQSGVLVFDLLNPGWAITLKTEVMAPLVKPEVLQLVDLSEGMLQCRAHLRYRIENAGLKTFRIKAPLPGMSLTFTGRNIARVAEVDKEKGVWQVDLQNKVEDTFSLVASYQVPYDPKSGGVKILPVKTLDTEDQRGYVTVTCGGRVQVEPKGELKGLKQEDPRNIPGVFGAGDLSSAILCYRTVQPDWDLSLSVVRHDEAKVLPASVKQVSMTSTLSPSGQMLTRVTMELQVGNLRFLKMELPAGEDSLWTVVVNGKEVSTSRDGVLHCIPLEEQAGVQSTAVDFIYAGPMPRRSLSGRQTFRAPRFVGLPLNQIDWNFYAMPDRTYYGFGGTMEHVEGEADAYLVYNADYYVEMNRNQKEQNLQTARQKLDQGEKLLKAGKAAGARNELQQALNYSQADESLNEDARIQLRNLQKQQVKMGLVKRRDAVRSSKNIVDEWQQGAANLPAMQQEGQEFTQEQASTMERRLTEKDNTALEQVANKILDQQAAAAGVVTAISITMPEHGKLLHFSRALQIDPESELSVSFKSSGGWLGVAGKVLIPALAFFIVAWLWLLKNGRQPAA